MGLLQKLQVKDPDHFFVVNAPERIKGLLRQEGLAQQIDPEAYEGGGLLLFVQNTLDLTTSVDRFLLDKEADNHWIAFPKRTSKIPTDLGRDHGWDQLIEANWIAVRQVSLNEKWSALRFRYREYVKEIRRGTDYPGIDSKRKTVTIPAILEERLVRDNLIDHFESLSFTKKKEAVISILEAKKPETLERRINKILRSLI